MLDMLRSEFAELLEQTDYRLTENLVRAAVRQYLKARARVLERNRDEGRYREHLRRKREQLRKYRAEGGPGKRRGREVVLNRVDSPRPGQKPVRKRSPKQRRGRSINVKAEPEYEVVWSGGDPLIPSGDA